MRDSRNVADPVVHRVGPVDPALLHQAGFEAQLGRHGRHLPSVVGLHATDRDEMRRALRQSVRDEVLQLAGLVPAKREPRVAVLPLGPDAGAAKMGRQAIKSMHRAGAEQQRIPREIAQRHVDSNRRRRPIRPA